MRTNFRVQSNDNGETLVQILTADDKITLYRNVIGFQIINEELGQQETENNKYFGRPVDSNNEYLVINIAGEEPIQFLNSEVELFVLKGYVVRTDINYHFEEFEPLNK